MDPSLEPLRLSMACSYRYASGKTHHDACPGWLVSSGQPGGYRSQGASAAYPAFEQEPCGCLECKHGEEE